MGSKIDSQMLDIHKQCVKDSSCGGSQITETEAHQLIRRAEVLNNSYTSSCYSSSSSRRGNKYLNRLMKENKNDFTPESQVMIKDYIKTGHIPTASRSGMGMGMGGAIPGPSYPNNPGPGSSGMGMPSTPIIPSVPVTSNVGVNPPISTNTGSNSNAGSVNAVSSNATRNRPVSGNAGRSSVPSSRPSSRNAGAVNSGSDIPVSGGRTNASIPPLPNTSVPSAGGINAGITPPIVGAPSVGVTPPTVGAPSIGVTPPNVGAPSIGVTPPNVGAPNVGVTPPTVNTPSVGVTPPNVSAPGVGVTPPSSNAPSLTSPSNPAAPAAGAAPDAPPTEPAPPRPGNVSEGSGIVGPHGKEILNFKAAKSTWTCHWFPLQETKAGGDPINNLHAVGGPLSKLDQLTGGSACSYEAQHNAKAFGSGKQYGWWGHCNNAAEVACVLQAPKHDVIMKGANGSEVKFSRNDIQGLLVKVSPGLVKNVDFKGQRYNNSGRDNPNEPAPEVFMDVLKDWSAAGLPFVLDIDNKEQVWNFPYDQAKIYESDKAPQGFTPPSNLPNDGSVKYYHIEMVGTGYDSKRRVYECYVQRDASGKAVSSAWIKTSNTHNNADFMWRPHPKGDIMDRSAWQLTSKPSNPHVDPQIVYDIYMKSIS